MSERKKHFFTFLKGFGHWFLALTLTALSVYISVSKFNDLGNSKYGSIYSVNMITFVLGIVVFLVGFFFISKYLFYKDWAELRGCIGWKIGFCAVGVVFAVIAAFMILAYMFFEFGINGIFKQRVIDDLWLIYSVIFLFFPFVYIEFREIGELKKRANELKDDTYLKTYTKKKVSVLNPQPSSIDLADIAHALSLNCRGNGQVPYFYSVAQHCINTAKEAKLRGYNERLQLIALLHDAAEAYITDLIRPVKEKLPLYETIENRYLEAIFTHFELSPVTDEEWKMVKEVDDDLLEYDLTLLLNEPEPEYGFKCKKEPDLEYKDPKLVEAEYIEMAEKLIEIVLDGEK